MKIENFGQNIAITPVNIYSPTCESEVLEILNRHRGQKIRCVGQLHSWSKIIVAEEVLLDLHKLCSVETGQDNQQKYCDVGAGCQIKRLLHELQTQKNWTLPSVGFITEQTVAGAISTGTHGSGRHSLSHYVQSVRLARYDPATGRAIIQKIDSGDELLAARCSLGCLGILLSVRMQCRSTYNVEEHFQEYSNLEGVLEREANYPLQQFYLVPWRWTFFAQHRRESLDSPSMLFHLYQWYRHLTFDWLMHLLILLCVRILKSNWLVQCAFRWIIPLCVLRNWRVRGPSTAQLVMEHELFRHVEIELFVSKSVLHDALNFLRAVLTLAAGGPISISQASGGSQIEEDTTKELEGLRSSYCHHYPICIRKVLHDATLVSMASGGERNEGSRSETQPEQDACWYSITLTNYHRGEARNAFERVASFLARQMALRFAARPHWGKLCPLDSTELRSLYPAFAKFQGIRDELDPTGVFSNLWAEQLFNCPQDSVGY